VITLIVITLIVITLIVITLIVITLIGPLRAYSWSSRYICIWL